MGQIQVTGTQIMTDISLPVAPVPRFQESDFRVGNVFNRAFALTVRNFLPFCTLTAITALPALYLSRGALEGGADMGMQFLGMAIGYVLALLSQAVLAHGAFEDLRGRPVRIFTSVGIGLGRLLPLLVIAVSLGLLYMLGIIALIVPGLIVLTAYYVATPACVIERIGPFKSMGRSLDLTKGHRWKIFGIMVVMYFANVVAGGVVLGVTAGGSFAGLAAQLMVTAILGAFSAVLGLVVYHDLRAAKEGVATDRLAAVFE
jgi:hypothetical protein